MERARFEAWLKDRHERATALEVAEAEAAAEPEAEKALLIPHATFP